MKVAAIGIKWTNEVGQGDELDHVKTKQGEGSDRVLLASHVRAVVDSNELKQRQRRIKVA
jgi:hypothetical protein